MTNFMTDDVSSHALSNVSSEALVVARDLSGHLVDAARDIARYATREVKGHPIASLAAGVTAGLALVFVIAARRSRRAAA